jgi:hypothetical protein
MIGTTFLIETYSDSEKISGQYLCLFVMSN